mgnify:CR=1 FL=1
MSGLSGSLMRVMRSGLPSRPIVGGLSRTEGEGMVTLGDRTVVEALWWDGELESKLWVGRRGLLTVVSVEE